VSRSKGRFEHTVLPKGKEKKKKGRRKLPTNDEQAMIEQERRSFERLLTW
jgi:hypothetical protein